MSKCTFYRVDTRMRLLIRSSKNGRIFQEHRRRDIVRFPLCIKAYISFYSSGYTHEICSKLVWNWKKGRVLLQVRTIWPLRHFSFTPLQTDKSRTDGVRVPCKIELLKKDEWKALGSLAVDEREHFFSMSRKSRTLHLQISRSCQKNWRIQGAWNRKKSK